MNNFELRWQSKPASSVTELHSAIHVKGTIKADLYTVLERAY